MKQENGTRYKNYCCWGQRFEREYDYKRNGILKHMMSRRIIETKNSITKFVIGYVEDSLIYFAKYIERLKHFKNIHRSNR